MGTARGWRWPALLTIPLVGLASLGAAHATGGQRRAIEQAAAAPFRDEIARDPHALCADLTPAAATAIVPPSAAPGSTCETAAQGVFAATAPVTTSGARVNVIAHATQLTIHGSRAKGVFALTTETGSGTRTGLRSAGRYRLELEQIAGRWLVSSEARLVAVPDCALSPPGRCHPGVQRLLFLLGEPVPERLTEAITIPKAVKRAGGSVLREFEAGASVVMQSGCLACHRIGSLGNRGPGPNLSRVGARLDQGQIERAIISPREPMPSFEHLPRKKLHALVRFLSLLR